VVKYDLVVTPDANSAQLVPDP